LLTAKAHLPAANPRQDQNHGGHSRLFSGWHDDIIERKQLKQKDDIRTNNFLQNTSRCRQPQNDARPPKAG
jgi:hypothetical protein